LAIYLFGSRSRGDHTEDSDFDLAVLVDPRIDREQVWNLRLEIADLISRMLGDRNFDLVVMGEDLDLTFRILREGQRLFARDHDEVCFREATLASMYNDYKPFLDSYLNKVAERFRKFG
jgi:predicted nucleotidyltransferase